MTRSMRQRWPQHQVGLSSQRKSPTRLRRFQSIEQTARKPGGIILPQFRAPHSVLLPSNRRRRIPLRVIGRDSSSNQGGQRPSGDTQPLDSASRHRPDAANRGSAFPVSAIRACDPARPLQARYCPSCQVDRLADRSRYHSWHCKRRLPGRRAAPIRSLLARISILIPACPETRIR